MLKLTEGRYALGALTVFAVWVFVVLPFLYVVPRLENPRKAHHDDRHQTAQSEPRGNADAPIFVQVVPGTKTAEESAQEAEEREEKRAADRWLVRWTAALFIATVGLILATAVLGYFAWQQSRDMKASIEIPKRALLELEAPIIGIKILNAGLHWDAPMRSFTGGILRYAFVNHGRTAATLFEIFDDTGLVNVNDGFPPPVNVQRGPPLPYGIFVPPSGETEPFNFNIFAPMLGVAAQSPERLRTIVPFFLGTVRYGDIFGNLYTMGFCFMFDNVGNRFIEAGGPEHSYCRKERGPYVPPGANRPAPQPPIAPQPDAPDDGWPAMS